MSLRPRCALTVEGGACLRCAGTVLRAPGSRAGLEKAEAVSPLTLGSC
jgi:hypothetical protein